MHIFLDESGCLGFDLRKKGTSRYFVITILIAKQSSFIASAVHRTIKAKFRQKKKTRQIVELKGSSSTFDVKNYFYHQITQHNDWYLHTIILDKSSLLSSAILKNNNIDQLYNLLAKNLLQNVVIPPDEIVIHLHVDRRKEKKEIDIFDAFIRCHLKVNIPAGCTLNIEHLRSHNNASLQAVDLFCYGIARKYERNDNEWYNISQHRIKRELIFRP